MPMPGQDITQPPQTLRWYLLRTVTDPADAWAMARPESGGVVTSITILPGVRTVETRPVPE
jgi:hypothetical protein